MIDRPNRRTPGPRPPIPLVVLAAVGVLFFSVPLLGLLLRARWADLPALLTTPFVLDALRLSVVVSLCSTAAALVVGVPVAWLLARAEFRGSGLVRSVVTLPLVLPPVVAGSALLFGLGRRGVMGEPLEELTGLVLPFSTAGAVVAAAFVATPFVIVTVEAGLRSLDIDFETAAASLGASRWTVMRRVTLPMIVPSIVAGAGLAWARAFGEFGATITFAGSLQGRTQTLPLAVYVALESDRDAAVAISLLMVVVALAVLVALRGRWWGNR